MCVYNMGIASIVVNQENIELSNKCQITSLNENKQETDESEKRKNCSMVREENNNNK